jgi:hypothetical protein
VAVMARGTALEKGGLRYRDGIGDDVVRGPGGPGRVSRRSLLSG